MYKDPDSGTDVLFNIPECDLFQKPLATSGSHALKTTRATLRVRVFYWNKTGGFRGNSLHILKKKRGQFNVILNNIYFLCIDNYDWKSWIKLLKINHGPSFPIPARQLYGFTIGWVAASGSKQIIKKKNKKKRIEVEQATSRQVLGGLGWFP